VIKNRFCKETVAFKPTHEMKEAIDKWVLDNNENISVILRHATKLGLIELGLLKDNNTTNNIT
jgi:hypothetical protein